MRTFVRCIAAAIARRWALSPTLVAKLKIFPLWHLSLWMTGLVIFINIVTTIARKSDSILLGLIGACLVFVTAASICHSIFVNRR